MTLAVATVASLEDVLHGFFFGWFVHTTIRSLSYRNVVGCSLRCSGVRRAGRTELRGGLPFVGLSRGFGFRSPLDGFRV